MFSNQLQTPQSSLVVGFIALLTGSIGAEIAPDALIERMLWPQRSNSGVNIGSIKNALFLSIGGPLHRVAIRAMDTIFMHGLQKGAGRGHLLGTAFYPDTGIVYRMHPGNGKPVEDEFVRNGLLVRILNCMSDTSSLAKHSKEVARMRQQITVSHLELFNFDNAPPQRAIALDTAEISSQTIITLLISEIPTVVLAALAARLGSIRAASVYLFPIIIKILCAYSATQREDLIIPAEKRSESWQYATKISKFEISIPGEGFQVISGPPDLILPFFRHYGHPIRCRWREVTQMSLVAAIGFSYPITLIATVLFMPPDVQWLWLTFQTYLVFAMLAVRYGGGGLVGSTEERVSRELLQAEKAGGNIVVLKNLTGEMIGAKLTRTLHGSYSEGKVHVSSIIGN